MLHFPSLNLCLKHNLVIFRSAEELYIEFNPSEVTFRPPVPVPKKTEPRANPSVTMHLRNEDLSNYVKEVSERHIEGTVDFSLLIAGHRGICDF
jgi:creatinine amidohydrolase/Fe(II)-dependent formamide hydrolase-like protein